MAKKSGSYISRKKPIRPQYLPPIPKNYKSSFDQGIYLLDHLSAENIEIYKKVQEKLQNYFYDEYYYYSSERAKRNVQIVEGLNKKTCKLSFENHYRCVTAEYNHCPLSSLGSKLSTIGGRFNFGSGNPIFPAFSALYLGENLVTSRNEILQKDIQNPNKISLEDFIGKSMSDFRIHGNLSSVLDITDLSNLKPFLRTLQKIDVSQDLTDKAILAGMSDRLNPIKKMSELSDALLDSYWRASIVRFDVPSNSQSFGNIVRAAKIEAIKYRSKYSSGYCLAIFPENLALGSFLELSDKSAPNVITRLDSTNFGQLT